MKIAAVIQARMSSRRLPGKVMHIIRGRPVLGHLLDRLRQCNEIDNIILATSSDHSDGPIAEFADKEGVCCYRASLDDVALRMLGAAQSVGADAFIRISGDSPLIDSLLIDRMVALYRESNGADIVTNVAKRTFPKGQSVEIITTDVLRRRIEAGMTASQKEHVTSSFYQQPNGLKIINVEHDDLIGELQLSVDTMEDMVRFDKLLGVLGEPYWAHGLDRIIEACIRLETIVA